MKGKEKNNKTTLENTQPLILSTSACNQSSRRFYAWHDRMITSIGVKQSHLRVWKVLTDITSEALSVISDKSWRMGVVAEKWRKANIISIFKKAKQKGSSQLQSTQIDANTKQNSVRNFK